MPPEGSDGQLVVRIDVDQQPAFGGTLRGTVRVQCVHAGVLQLDERGELSFAGRLGNVAVSFGTERIEGEHVQFDSRHISRNRRQDGVDRNLGLGGQLAVPECVEVIGTRCRKADLRGCDSGADGVESVVATGVAAGVSGRGAGCARRGRGEAGGRFHSDVDHFGLIAGDFNLVLAGRKIELAFFEHHRVIASNRSTCMRTWVSPGRASRSSRLFRRCHKCRWRDTA